MSCENCKTEPLTIPYAVYETAMARQERTHRRLVAALVISILLMFITNAIWLFAWTSYDYSGEETVITQDGEGLNIYGDRNVTDYGTNDQN